LQRTIVPADTTSPQLTLTETLKLCSIFIRYIIFVDTFLTYTQRQFHKHVTLKVVCLEVSMRK